MHKTRIDIAEGTRSKVIALIQPRLADSVDLYSQMKQAHWNVKGPSFAALHELFDRIAGEALDQSDMLAERITALGGQADGTVRQAAATSALAEYPHDARTQTDHIDAVAQALAIFGRGVRAACAQAAEIGDDDTADLFTEISRAVDKNLWLVEAHTQSAE